MPTPEPDREPRVVRFGWRGCLDVAAIVAIILLVVAYLAIHAARYHACVVQPGLFDWPDGCL